MSDDTLTVLIVVEINELRSAMSKAKSASYIYLSERRDSGTVVRKNVLQLPVKRGARRLPESLKRIIIYKNAV